MTTARGGRLARALAIAALAAPFAVAAHGFGRLYNLPVPFWLYAYGAAAALVVSFLVVGYFVSAPAPAAGAPARDISSARWVAVVRRGIPAVRLVSVSLLLLCIATGLLGNRDPYRNFSMPFFWVWFVLGLTYVTALVGNVYSFINPWRVLVDTLARIIPGFARGRVAYPAWLGDWPALALYMAFVAFELFAFVRPPSLGAMLAAYTFLNLAGTFAVGARAWFEHCEFFAVFLRLISLIAPLDYQPMQPGGRGSLRVRPYFAGLVSERPQVLSRALFAFAMLATTAFDGLRATQSWVWLFWHNAWIAQQVGAVSPIYAYVRLRPWYVAWEMTWLVVAPFLYFGVYVAFVAAAKAVTRSPTPLRELVLDFAYTLLPIALVYNVTHYYTLLLTDGLKIVSLLSDPFGWGWNLFGTAQLLRAPILPDVGLVWHTQVAIILLGHVVSVYLAHRVALRVFPTRRAATLSQLPMLALMVLFTVFGLWILAQPLTAMRMR